jgi:DNA-binding response OmpR family regulator
MSPTRRNPLVLVVDGDTATSSMLAGLLTGAGFQTACAYDSAGAWAGIRQHLPDLVLLDVNLPDGSGLDVCRRLQQEPETVHNRPEAG